MRMPDMSVGPETSLGIRDMLCAQQRACSSPDESVKLGMAILQVNQMHISLFKDGPAFGRRLA
eukprot:3003513-Amphidinium_carterae.1